MSVLVKALNEACGQYVVPDSEKMDRMESQAGNYYQENPDDRLFGDVMVYQIVEEISFSDESGRREQECAKVVRDVRWRFGSAVPIRLKNARWWQFSSFGEQRRWA